MQGETSDSWGKARHVRRRRFVLLAIAAAGLCLRCGQHSPAQAAPALTRIRTLYVDQMGDGDSAATLRRRIVEHLEKSGKIRLVSRAADADAVLRGSFNVWSTGTISMSPHASSARLTTYQGYLSVELLGKSDETLWSYLVTPSRLRTFDIIDDLAGQMAARLLTAVQSGMTGANSAAPSRYSQVELHGAGSTLAGPLYMRWFQSSGMHVRYDSVGSEAGIEDLVDGRVDFAASDMPLTAENTPAGLHVLHLPTVVGGVVPIYNLPSLRHTLRLTPQVLALIYSGTIRKWNDPRIVADNRGSGLPDADISVVHRTDGSGTTYVWTNFLAKASPDWRASTGSGPRVTWPIGEGANGNEGVADLVQKTPASIGYVEVIYAIQHQLGYASVRNSAGEFIKADLASITAAASAASKGGEDFRYSILDAPGKLAYPISTFTWLLVPERGMSSEKRTATAELLEWALTSGQRECSALGYVALPREVIARELTAVETWKGAE
jgi:phosphate ABC transporter phosphate-binding protein